jgi:hypothetical protein
MSANKVHITVNVPSDEFDSFCDWLEANDPTWDFHYSGKRDVNLRWYKSMAEEDGIMSWHLFLDPKAAMLARLSWDTWCHKAVDS